DGKMVFAGFADGDYDQAHRSAHGRDGFSDDEYSASGTGSHVVSSAGGVHRGAGTSRRAACCRAGIRPVSFVAHSFAVKRIYPDALNTCGRNPTTLCPQAPFFPELYSRLS